MPHLSQSARLILCSCVGAALGTIASAGVLLCSGMFTVALAHEPAVPHVSAKVADAEVIVQGDTALATFKIHVTNHEESPMTNFWVVFADGSSIPIGDVSANSTVVSELQNRVVEILLPDSQSIPVPVTLTFSFDGTPVEVPFILNLGAQ